MIFHRLFPQTLSWLVPLALFVSLATAQSRPPGSPPLPGGDETVWEPVVEAYNSVFREATDPVPIERLVLPWEPTTAVLLAFPLSDLGEDVALSRIFRDTLAALLPHVRVIGLYHQNDRRLLGGWLNRLELDARIEPHLGQLELLSTEANSIWIRDFAPVFAWGKDKGLVLLDATILDPAASLDNLMQAKGLPEPLDQHFTMVQETLELKGTLGADRVPSDLMGFLASRMKDNPHFARAPVFLPGGDLVLPDEDSAILSAATVAVNGGDLGQLRTTLKDYYGIKNLHVLENLPGQTIEHMDFTLNAIQPGVLLTAEAGVSLNGDRPFVRYLERELNQRLEHQHAYLVEHFPDHEILKVPFLSPVLSTDEDIRKEVMLHIMRMIADQNRWGMPPEEELAAIPMEELEVDERILNALTLDAGVLNWKDPADQEKAARQYLNHSMKDLVRNYVERNISYRSYLNSLYVKVPDGPSILLLPSYRPLNEEEAARMTSIERKVGEIYRQACPDARQVWIECTELAGFLGVIHCFTATVPAVD